MVTSYYKTKYNRTFTPGEELPVISTDLDSVRVYQFEAHFFGLPNTLSPTQELTLAVKKVSTIGMDGEEIVVDRVNDKVYYPGKVTPQELVVTFDNLYLRKTNEELWNWFKHIYDPLTGEMTKLAQPGGIPGNSFKVNKLEIIMLDNTISPHSVATLMGVWPKNHKMAEFNYSTNDFHTIDVSFRWDFMNIADVH